MNNEKRTLFLFVLTTLTLIAETNNTLPSQTDSLIPNVPEFSTTYQGESLLCFPTGLIKTKSHKDLVSYKCQKKYVDDNKLEKKPQEERGLAETQRLYKDVQNKIAKGTIYSVEIPLSDAKSPRRAKRIAQRQLDNKPHGKYLRMLLPAKFYLSIRPQFSNSGEDGKIELRNGGSRAGFFYYHQFNNDMELMLQYEAGVDGKGDTHFVNLSDASDSNRRLSYFALKYMDNSIIMGKYWSAYYDIASFTDLYMAYGAQSSGAFNGGTDGSPSGTGRAGKMLQIRRIQDTYDATLQVQYKHDALRDLNTDYSYTMAGSLIYKGWKDIKLGASVAYAKFDEIAPEAEAVGIDGNDLSTILGVSYQKDNYGINAVLSYTKNHMSDDQGVYFDGASAELYMRYDIDNSFRLAGGGNWLFPKDNDYKGQFSIKNVILSLQYTFGEKTFDDLVYVEVSLPNGKLANGDRRDTSVAIGLRYLFDN